MAIKLDMNKTYDRVEWGFIEKVMERMGFHERWICLIMSFITNITHYVLINGVAHGCIVRSLSRGSPFPLLVSLICIWLLIPHKGCNKKQYAQWCLYIQGMSYGYPSLLH